MYEVIIDVFDNNKGGVQLTKKLEAKTLIGLYNKINKLEERYEIYEVARVSPSLVDNAYINSLGWGWLLK